MTERARTVCTVCHQRKVRCDLQDSHDGVCKNCSRSGQQCIPRHGARILRKHQFRRDGRRNLPTPPALVDDRNSVPISSQLSAIPSAQRELTPADSGPRSNEEAGYYGDYSMLLPQEPSSTTPLANHLQNRIMPATEAILKVTEADVLPKPALREALIDSFFDHLYYRYPLVERQELLGPDASVLLIQAVCMSGSQMRHWDSSGISLTQSLYEKVKTLIHLRYEPDSMKVLKAMCLISTWSPNSSESLSLDSPWHWTGQAIRLAIQMGMHRKPSYSKKPDVACRRRIWWLLFVGDKLQCACFCRPATIKSTDCDIPPISLDDFAVNDTHSRAFIQCTRLCIILGKIADYSTEKQTPKQDGMAKLTQSLCAWLRELPEDLRLFDSLGIRNPYRLHVLELHIMYFSALVLLQASEAYSGKEWSTTGLSIIASSCIARLYEQIYYHGHVNFLLPIDAFYCMVSAVPQIYNRPTNGPETDIRHEEFDIIRSVIKQLQTRFGGATTVSRNISKLTREVEWSKDSSVPPGSVSVQATGVPSAWKPSIMNQYALELFPFPLSLCPNMALLSRLNMSELPPAETSQLVMDDLAEWTFDEPQYLLDIFSLMSEESITRSQ